METILKDIVQNKDLLQNAGTYWKYMDPEFAAHLDNYLPVFEKYRSDIGVVPNPESWQSLPFETNDKSWKWRRESLSLLQSIIGGRMFDSTLEIGAWNGWLTKHLAQMSKTVIGIDYFTHPLDGIGNIAHFSPNIHAVQCNLEKTPSVFKSQSFDLIVVNHCLSYTQNPVGFLKNLIPLLRSGGILVSIGNSYYRNPDKKIKENEIFTQRFRQQYHLEVFIQAVKGFMDTNDVVDLRQHGFTIKPYPKRILHNIHAQWHASAPHYVAFIYQNKNA